MFFRMRCSTLCNITTIIKILGLASIACHNVGPLQISSYQKTTMEFKEYKIQLKNQLNLTINSTIYQRNIILNELRIHINIEDVFAFINVYVTD